MQFYELFPVRASLLAPSPWSIARGDDEFLFCQNQTVSIAIPRLMIFLSWVHLLRDVERLQSPTSYTSCNSCEGVRRRLDYIFGTVDKFGLSHCHLDRYTRLSSDNVWRELAFGPRLRTSRDRGCGLREAPNSVGTNIRCL